MRTSRRFCFWFRLCLHPAIGGVVIFGKQCVHNAILAISHEQIVEMHYLNCFLHVTDVTERARYGLPSDRQFTVDA